VRGAGARAYAISLEEAARRAVTNPFPLIMAAVMKAQKVEAPIADALMPELIAKAAKYLNANGYEDITADSLERGLNEKLGRLLPVTAVTNDGRYDGDAHFRKLAQAVKDGRMTDKDAVVEWASASSGNLARFAGEIFQGVTVPLHAPDPYHVSPGHGFTEKQVDRACEQLVSEGVYPECPHPKQTPEEWAQSMDIPEPPEDPTEGEEDTWLSYGFATAVDDGDGWGPDIDIAARRGFRAIYRRRVGALGQVGALWFAAKEINEALRYALETIETAVEEITETIYPDDPPEED
jgi:hypothetical protein